MSVETPIIKWQRPMRRVLYALAPISVSAVWFFGWRAALMLLVCNAAGFLAEYAFTSRQKQPVTSAVFVSGTLFALSLPPTLPFWMAIVGIVFGIVFGKMVFGGFGRNVFNPAMIGRAFIYVSFGNYMTSIWAEPLHGGLRGLAAYSPDAVTTATPGMLLKTGADIPWSGLLTGNTPGTLGGTSAVLVVLGGLYIVWTKAANYRIVVSGLAGFLVTQTILWMCGVHGAADPIRAMLAGSFLVGVFFYATDPVSASQTNEGRWIYGAFIGCMSPVIAIFSVWPAGTMFAILLANMFAPITDYAIRALKGGNRGRVGMKGKGKLKESVVTVTIMFALTFVFISLVSAVHLATRETVDRNQSLFIRRAVMLVAGAGIPASGAGVLAWFDASVVPHPDASHPEWFTIRDAASRQTNGYAFIATGAGLWGPITAIVGLSADLGTITGVTFVDQNETPGLGARIEESWFKNQFKGAEALFTLVPEGTHSKTPSEVDAITGATITSKAVQGIVNGVLEKAPGQLPGREAR